MARKATLEDVIEALSVLGDRLDRKIDISNAELVLRLDKLIDNSGSHYRQLERRIEALERKVG